MSILNLRRMPKDRDSPYAKSPAPGIRPPPKPAAEVLENPMEPADDPAEVPADPGLAAIMTQLTDIKKGMCTKQDIADLVTKKHMEKQVEAAKEDVQKWTRERFARKTDIMPRIKALEQSKKEDAERRDPGRRRTNAANGGGEAGERKNGQAKNTEPNRATAGGEGRPKGTERANGEHERQTETANGEHAKGRRERTRGGKALRGAPCSYAGNQ